MNREIASQARFEWSTNAEGIQIGPAIISQSVANRTLDPRIESKREKLGREVVVKASGCGLPRDASSFLPDFLDKQRRNVQS